MDQKFRFRTKVDESIRYLEKFWLRCYINLKKRNKKICFFFISRMTFFKKIHTFTYRYTISGTLLFLRLEKNPGRCIVGRLRHNFSYISVCNYNANQKSRLSCSHSLCKIACLWWITLTVLWISLFNNYGWKRQSIIYL